MPPSSPTPSPSSRMSTPASAEPRRYRGAVIGAGGIARQAHLPAFLEAPSVRGRVAIVALVDSAPDLAPVDGIPLLSRREQLAGAPPADFIDVCTPTATHLDLTLWGLEQGYHVLCEKPVAVTRAEADRIAAAARARGRLVMPCHQYRFNPAWTKVKQWLDEGAIGRWHLAEFSVYRLMADPGRQAGGGGGGGGGDTPWRGTSAAGRGGGLVERMDVSAELDKSAYHRWFAELFASFVAALDHGAAPDPYLEDIRRVASVVEHAYEAARTGCKVAISDGA